MTEPEMATVGDWDVLQGPSANGQPFVIATRSLRVGLKHVAGNASVRVHLVDTEGFEYFTPCHPARETRTDTRRAANTYWDCELKVVPGKYRLSVDTSSENPPINWRAAKNEQWIDYSAPDVRIRDGKSGAFVLPEEHALLSSATRRARRSLARLVGILDSPQPRDMATRGHSARASGSHIPPAGTRFTFEKIEATEFLRRRIPALDSDSVRESPIIPVHIKYDETTRKFTEMTKLAPAADLSSIDVNFFGNVEGGPPRKSPPPVVKFSVRIAEETDSGDLLIRGGLPGVNTSIVKKPVFTPPWSTKLETKSSDPNNGPVSFWKGLELHFQEHLSAAHGARFLVVEVTFDFSTDKLPKSSQKAEWTVSNRIVLVVDPPETPARAPEPAKNADASPRRAGIVAGFAHWLAGPDDDCPDDVSAVAAPSPEPTRIVRGGGPSADRSQGCRCPADARELIIASAAHFPIVEFGLRGERHPSEGAVIYENMKVTLCNDGNYQVTFETSTPMTTQLRLQLLLRDKSQRWYTLTLPVYTVTLDDDTGREEQGEIRRVEIHGFASFIENRAHEFNLVRRRGVARFGSLPATD